MLVFDQNNRVGVIKRMLFYHRHISVLVFFQIFVCSLLLACILESIALRVGVKTLYHTIQTVIELSESCSNHSMWHCVVLIKLLD